MTAAEILPGQTFSGFEAPAAQFMMYGSPLSWDQVGELLWPDGGEGKPVMQVRIELRR